jgi:hypothetical protein
MKPRPHSRRLVQGSILLITVCLSFIIGIVLISCLSLVKNQNQSVARSQAWNTCIPVIEAGIEEAMAHLNNRLETSYAVNGWTQTGDVYTRERTFADTFYTAQITLTDPLRPLIVCTGYVRLPVLVADAGSRSPLLAAAAVNVGGVQYIARAVQVVAKKEGMFSKAMVAKDQIDMTGNGSGTDSFDSTNPLYSTNGMYDPTRARDNGDVATNSGLTNSIGVGNADIKGHLETGPGGTASVGANGTVGSLAWHNAGNNGIEPGWARDDMNIYLPDVQLPFTGGAFAPVSGTVTGAVYKYLLTGGDYEISSLTLGSSERLAVTGNATLLVDGNVTITGGIDIMPGGSLKLYVAGPSATIGGTGVNNTGRATNFVYFGLPGNTSLTLPSNGDFVGCIYAPEVALKLSGGGSTMLHFVGACVARSIKVNGHYTFHYDEALRGSGQWQDFVIISWVEL